MNKEDKYIYQKRYYYKHKEEIYKKLKNKLQNDKEFREKRNIKGRELRRMKSKELINLRSLLSELEEWLKGRIEWNKSILEEDKGKSDLLGFNFHREAYIKIWEDTLDKIQELKEKYK